MSAAERASERTNEQKSEWPSAYALVVLDHSARVIRPTLAPWLVKTSDMNTEYMRAEIHIRQFPFQRRNHEKRGDLAPTKGA